MTAPTRDHQLIELAHPPLDSAAGWQPVERHEVVQLIRHLNLDAEGSRRLRVEAARVLSRCVPPTDPGGEETGLVIGYVQSGKTMSFTTVAALARDNGYRLIIVLTGISTNLFEQSMDRLLTDLQIRTRADRKWTTFANPNSRTTARNAMQDTLAAWTDPTVPEAERQTILLMVMKNARHLSNLNTVLSQLDLRGVPALVIDDEADQAGLNTAVNQQAQSATYRHLLAIKQNLPHHSVLQYTATPQAPLLINLIDVLSPNFAELLTPGAEYVGGKDFFVDRPDLIRMIPQSDIPARGTAPLSPPESLLHAMRLFFVGVAAGLVQHGNVGNRAMLVHPSQETGRHNVFFRWVRDIKTSWQTALALPVTSPDHQDLILEFEQAYGDLVRTVSDIPSFDAIRPRLLHALRQTREEEVNTRGNRRTPPISWHDHYGHILVGGQAMDRGFTVKGLTVTYMPRNIGGGNADTVQQRARFFGYKRSYFGYCRVFLEAGAADAYRRYVTHEEDVRSRIAEHAGRPLAEWRREFLLAQSLKPTRDCVLDLPYMRIPFGGTWYVPRVPHETDPLTDRNRDAVRSFVAQLGAQPDGGDDRRTDMQRHLVRHEYPLLSAYEGLLTQYGLGRLAESSRYTALLLQVKQICDDTPDATCTVYVISRGVDPTLTRERPVNDNGELTSYIFQGEGRRVGSTSPYPGDQNLPCPDPIHIQIHHLDLIHDRQRIASDLPVVAVLLPRSSEGLLVQAQGGS